MFYSIFHHTRHDYSQPVSESHMEARIMPRSGGAQRCLSFDLAIDPRANVLRYQDYSGNMVHHFDVPGQYTSLSVTARSVVEMLNDFPDIPALDAEAWQELDHQVSEGDYWELLMPSRFVRFTPLLLRLVEDFQIVRRGDPYSLLREINERLFEWLEYSPTITKVDSPIDLALTVRTGVCQDFSHIMLALVRHLGIPARYVSGYFFSGSEESAGVGSTHAWIEALLPRWGWVGFDPSNNCLARSRHIRTAYGRDYADVPPTRGVFKGEAESTISVKVEVKEIQQVPKRPFSFSSPLDMSF